MSLLFTRSYQIRVPALFLVLMTSCSYQHWVKPGEVYIRDDETVYRLVTMEGDTVSFAGTEFVERERNHLTGFTPKQFIGHGGVYSGGSVSGVDCEGDGLLYTEENIFALEVPDRTAVIGIVALIIVSIPAAILVMDAVMESGYDPN